jgi:hypothetical protein
MITLFKNWCLKLFKPKKSEIRKLIDGNPSKVQSIVQAIKTCECETTEKYECDVFTCDASFKAKLCKACLKAECVEHGNMVAL